MYVNLNDKSTLLRSKRHVQFLVLSVLNKATKLIVKELVPVLGIKKKNTLGNVSRCINLQENERMWQDRNNRSSQNGEKNNTYQRNKCFTFVMQLGFYFSARPAFDISNVLLDRLEYCVAIFGQVLACFRSYLCWCKWTAVKPNNAK